MGGGGKPHQVYQVKSRAEGEEVKKAGSPSSTDNMDIKQVIEELETGGQDTVLMALQSYNKEVKLCAVNALLLTSQFNQI